MKRILLTIAFAILSQTCFAYDFSAICSTGQTLYFNILTDSSVSVTYPQYNSYGNNYYYGYSRPTGNLIIPDSVIHDSIYYKVVSIGDYAFYGCSDIQNILIPNSVNSIGHSSFSNCSSIQSLVVPNNVTNIGDYAFASCSGIDSLYIGSSVESIGSWTFQGCTGLRYMFYNARSLGTSYFMGGSYYSPFNTSTPLFTTLVIGDSVDSIPINCFYGRSCIDGTLVILDNVMSIGEGAFSGCTGIDSLYLGSGLTTIGSSTFNGCSNIHTLTIPDNVMSIGEAAFYGCSSVDSLYLGSGLATIGSYAFQGCTNINSLTIPDNVTSMGPYAFYGCSGIDSLYLGNGLTTIGGSAFQGCTSLRYMFYNTRSLGTSYFMEVVFSNTSIPYFTTLVIGDSVTSIPTSFFHDRSSIDSIYLGSGLTTISSNAFQGCTNIHTLTIPNNVTSIGPYAFYGCSGVDSIYLGSGLTTIGSYAFQGCTNIHTLTIPDNVTSMGEGAFSGCTGIDSLYLGSGLTTIGSSTFNGCSNIHTLTIPDNVTSIGASAFSGCYGIDSMYIGSSVESIGRWAFQGCTGLRYMFYNARSLGTSYFMGGSYYSPFSNTSTPLFMTLVIGDSVDSIPTYCFYDCSSIDSAVVIPNNVTSIGEYAFYNGTGIDSLYLGSGLTTIGNNAFNGCSNIHTLTIPDNVTSIGAEAFYGCSSIDSIYLGSGLTTIGSNAFQGCTNIHSLTIPDNVTSIGGGCFFDCTGIDSLYLGSGLTSIGNNAFQGCTGLRYMFYNSRSLGRSYFMGNVFYSPFYNTPTPYFTTLVIGDSVDSIPTYCFYERSSIDRAVVIPDNVTSIGEGAFYGCSGIDSLYLGNGLTTIGSNAFQGCSNIHTLTIPDNVTSIGDGAFYGCSDIDSLYLGSRLTTIGSGAFQGCTGLKYIFYNARRLETSYFMGGDYGSPFYNTSTPLFTTLVIGDSVDSIPINCFYGRSCIDGTLEIPDNVTSIGQYALYGCTGIDSLYLGSRLTTIGIRAFEGCTGLRYIFYNARSLGTSYFMGGDYSSPFYNTSTPLFTTLVIGDSVDSIPTYCFFGRISINGTVVIPDNVTSIGEAAFYRCSGVDSLYLGSGLATIGSYAFEGCTNIHTLTISDNVTSIGQSAFNGCTGIDSLHLGSGLTIIGNSAFQGCSNIHTLTIPDNVAIVEESAFYGCSRLNSITFNARECLTMNSGSVFAECDSVRYLEIGENVHRFPDNAFTRFNSLLDTIPWLDSLRYVGRSNFSNWSYSGNCMLSSSVDTIEDDAFQNCDNMLSISTNARYIGNNAFANCDRLVSVTLGDSVQTLGSGAFSGCFRLNNVSLGEGITSIGDSAFSGCIRLIKPEMPNSLTTIGTRAFDGCGDINGKLTFPASITHIGDYAYNGVGNITEIEMKGSTPPTIHAHTFAAVDSMVTVSVPCGAVLNYYITDYWENFPNIVEAPPYRLTVQSNNEVMGSATVTQQTTCSNHTATIYAVAQTGYHFLQWNDGITANPRSIPMTQDSAFTAIFVVNNSYITVHANDSTMGSVSGTGLYGYNAPVTLTATAYSGYHFLRWSDGNTQNPRYLAAVRDSSFTAIFVSNVSTITVVNANPDMGNVGGSGVYYYQNLVSLTATANYGYHFVQWNDGNTQNPRTILVSQDSSFTAYFALNTYSIVATSNSTTMGSVSGGGQYTYLHEMSMTATPAYGYHFVQWNDGVTDNPRTLTVTRDSAFTAQFAANSYTLTVAPNDATMGSAYGAGSYNYNTTATLTAVPNYGYHFTQWSDAVTDNPRTVTVLNNATYTAQFEINSYVITVQSSNPAIGTTSGSGSYNYLTPVNITALPNAGYHFTQWSDGNTDNPRLISVTANATYTAQFAINSYAVGVTSNNSTMGSVSGSGTYNHNSTATLTATAYYGYHFVQWQDGNTLNPRTVVVTDSAQYSAQFDYNSYLVTALSSNVTLGTATGGGSYNYLSQVALTAVPAPHYHFTMWNDSVEDNPRTLTVTRDTTLTAHFAIDRHIIGVNTANATQGSANGSSTVDYNTAVWITATANYGYHFTQWHDGNSSNPRRVVVSQDTVFTASFAPNQYTATCSANDNTRGSVTSAGGSYNYLTSLTFTAVPDANYHFLRWSNGSTDNPITFTLTKDTALTAIFVGLTANVNDNLLGTATHTKLANLLEEVTATPNYGYHFVQWQDGNSDNPRTVTLTQDTTMTAYFAVNTYYLTLVSNDSTMGTVTGSGSYNYLTQVTLTATANEHYHFVQWNDGNTTNPRLITLTSDTTFIAQFEEDAKYSITVSSNDTAMGTVAGSGSYYGGEQVVLTASPREHYHFVQWGDGNTQNPRTITVVGDADYTAVFEADIFTITVTANDPTMGSVMGGGEYGYGTEVTIAAQPFAGYGFRGWSDGDTNRERTIVVTDDADYQAIFYDMIGISDVEILDYSVNVKQNNIHIAGVSQRKVAVYDLSGRRIAYIDKSPETYIVTVPATGVYLIQVEGMRARKVVVY